MNSINVRSKGIIEEKNTECSNYPCWWNGGTNWCECPEAIHRGYGKTNFGVYIRGFSNA